MPGVACRVRRPGIGPGAAGGAHERGGAAAARGPAADQALHRHAGARRGRLRRPRRRGPCAARRERRRQVDADQGAGRRAPRRCGRDPAARPRRSIRSPSSCRSPSSIRISAWSTRMTRGRERRGARRLSAPPRPDLLARRAGRRRGCACSAMGGGVDPEARVGDLPAAEKSIVAIARAMAVQMRSSGARRADRGACRRPTSRACSRCCAACARAASASSMSPTGSTRCSASPTA